MATYTGTSGDDILVGSSSADTINAGAGADQLTGGGGADMLYGEDGADTYFYASGDGNDQIWDAGLSTSEIDILKLTNLNAANIGLSRSNNELVVTDRTTGQTVTVGFAFNAAAGTGLERIEFADGSYWTRAQIDRIIATSATSVAGAPIFGTSSGETLAGTASAEFIFGDAGDDTISGNDGADRLYGDAGDDILAGGAGADILTGGAGIDQLTGGTGNDNLYGEDGGDTYFYTSGDGVDQIWDAGFSTSETDTLKLTDLNAGSISLSRSNNELIVTDDTTGQTITVGYAYNNTLGTGLERIEFADGSYWTRAQIDRIVTTNATAVAGAPIFGTTSADIISGTSAAEFIFGDTGDDTISGNDGDDRIYGDAGADALTGGTGADTLAGGDGADQLTGGAGNDMLQGGLGADTYSYTSGDGTDQIWDDSTSAGEPDVLKFTNLNAVNVGITRSGYSMIVTDKTTGQTITVGYQFDDARGLEKIEFADGSYWTRAQIDRIAATNATSVAGAPIFGTTGNDTITGTSVAEFIFGDAGDDTISGADGDDRLYGDAGTDVLSGGAGADTLAGGDGADQLAGGLGNDALLGSAGADTYVYTSGDGADTLTDDGVGAGEVDTLKLLDVGASGVILTRSGSSLLIKDKATNQTVTVNSQFDLATGIDRLEFSDGSYWTRAQFERIANLNATSVAGVPVLGTTAGDTLIGTSNAEFILAEGGDDALSGLGGDDRLYGDGGNDSLTGGQGSDLLYGGLGADTYVYSSGDGVDQIWDDSTSAGEPDVLKFTNLNAVNVGITRSGYSMIVTDKTTGQTITVGYQFDDLRGLEKIEFADGSYWTRAQIDRIAVTNATSVAGAPIFGTTSADSLTGTSVAEFVFGDAGDDTISGADGDDRLYGDAGADALLGGTGADTLVGGDGADQLTGGVGNDMLQGGLGADTYIYASGDGTDQVWDDSTSAGEPDVLKFTNLDAANVGITRSGYSMIVTDKTTGQTITVGYQFDDLRGLEKIEFADGSYWTRAQINRIAATNATSVAGAPIFGTTSGDTLTGTTAAEFLFGDAGDDTISGNDGGDRLYGDAGADILSGGGGADILTAGVGADQLTGGTGNDVLYGEDGADTYIYASGDGVDQIWDAGFSTSELDFLKFTDLNAASISLSRSNNELVVTDDSTGQTITVGFAYNNTLGTGLERIEFADGSYWTRAQIDRIVTTNATSVTGAPIFGTTGADTIVGTSSAEFIFADAGDDTVSGNDGTDRIYGDAGADILSGGAGADTMFGGLGADQLTGGTDADLLKGDDGADLYFYTSGDGADAIWDDGFSTSEVDVLKLTNLAAANVSLSRSNNELVVTDDMTGQSITLGHAFNASGGLGVERIEFSDGSYWTRAQVDRILATNATSAAGAPVFGTTGADTISGTSAAEFIFGDASDDTISGNSGDDRLYGDAGADSLAGGAGADLLEGGVGNDTFVFNSTLDSNTAGGIDRIVDYSAGDLVNMSAIDADSVTGGDQGFTVVSAFTNQAGQGKLTYDAGLGRTLFSGDVDGDGVADFSFWLNGQQSSTTGWIL